MAGSWGHVADGGPFRGVQLLDDLGDAWEAVQEMYGMIYYLAGGNAERIGQAAAHWRDGLLLAPARGEEVRLDQPWDDV